MSNLTVRLEALALAVAFAVAAPAVASAQQPPVDVGDRVRITTSGTTLTGTVRTATLDELGVLLNGEAVVRTYPFAVLDRLEVARAGDGARLLKAVGAGWLWGMAGAGAWTLVFEGSSVSGGLGTNLKVGTVVGVLVSIAVSGTGGTSWRQVPLDRFRPVALAEPQPVAAPDSSGVPLASVPATTVPDASVRAALERAGLSEAVLARSWVRVRTRGGQEREGALRSVTADSLTLQSEDGSLVTLPRPTVTTVDLHDGRRRRPVAAVVGGALGGAAIGALIGLGADRFSGYGCAFGSCGGRSHIPRYASRGAREGLFAGIVAAPFLTVDVWERVPLGRVPTLAVAPTPEGGVAVGLSFEVGR